RPRGREPLPAAQLGGGGIQLPRGGDQRICPGLLRLQPRRVARYPGGRRGAAAGSSPVGAAARYRAAPGGRRDHRTAEELREAARQIAGGEGVGVADVVLPNDRPVPVVAQQIMTWLGWV